MLSGWNLEAAGLTVSPGQAGRTSESKSQGLETKGSEVHMPEDWKANGMVWKVKFMGAGGEELLDPKGKNWSGWQWSSSTLRPEGAPGATANNQGHVSRSSWPWVERELASAEPAGWAMRMVLDGHGGCGRCDRGRQFQTTGAQGVWRAVQRAGVLRDTVPEPPSHIREDLPSHGPWRTERHPGKYRMADIQDLCARAVQTFSDTASTRTTQHRG